MTIDEILSEKWLPIPDFDGYFVSNLGRVKGLWDTILRPGKSKRGYLSVWLSRDAIVQRVFVHRLVLLAFVGTSNLQTNHIDCNKANNKLSNLEYLTASANCKYTYDSGCRNMSGEGHNQAKLTNEQIEEIRFKSNFIRQKELAKVYNVSFQTISSIINRKTWRHI